MTTKLRPKNTKPKIRQHSTISKISFNMDEIELEIEESGEFGRNVIVQDDQDMEEGEIAGGGEVEKVEIREINESVDFRPRVRRSMADRLGPKPSFSFNDDNPVDMKNRQRLPVS
jgi:hypothetical protein